MVKFKPKSGTQVVQQRPLAVAGHEQREHHPLERRRVARVAGGLGLPELVLDPVR